MQRDPAGVLAREREAADVRDLDLLARREVYDRGLVLNGLPLPAELLRLAARGVDREGRVPGVTRKRKRGRGRRRARVDPRWATAPFSSAAFTGRKRVFLVAARLADHDRTVALGGTDT